MMRSLLRDSILGKLLLVAACLAATGVVEPPAAWAQRTHVGGGGARMAAPPRMPAPPILHAPIISGPRFMPGARFAPGFRPGGVGRFRVVRPPILVFRQPVFSTPAFVFGLGFSTYWLPGCAPLWNWGWWNWGFGCNNWGAGYSYGFENYATAAPYQPPLYVYSGGVRDLVWLFLNDGTVYEVTDYWLLDGQVHFIMVDETGKKLVEHAIPLDELDLQKSIDVNTRRGFRFVWRDEPWQQYLRHHPDSVPPPAGAPSKNS